MGKRENDEIIVNTCNSRGLEGRAPKCWQFWRAKVAKASMKGAQSSSIRKITKKENGLTEWADELELMLQNVSWQMVVFTSLPLGYVSC